MKANNGAALITALFIMTLVAIAAVAMSVNLELSIRRTQLSVTATQLYYAAEGVQFWAKGVLEDDAQHDPIVDKIPQQFGPVVQNGVTISGQLLDAQSRFNLNNLTKAAAIPQFVLLLQAVIPNLNTQQAITIANATANWLTASTADASANQYIEVYRKMQPPYQASYMPMASPSELRLVDGITSDDYQKLFPFVIALPGTTKINLNTAPAPVIMSLAKSITNAQAQAFITTRPAAGFANMDDLSANSAYQSLKISSDNATLSSQYFLAIATATSNSQHLILYSLLSRQQINHQWQVSVLWQAENDY